MNVFFTSLLKRIYLQRKVFVSLFLIFLSVTFFSHFLFEKRQTSVGEDRYLFDLQTKAQEALQKSDEDIKTITNILYSHRSKDLSFNDLTVETNYPFYIYKKKKIVYWSDYHFVPNLEEHENGEKKMYPIEQLKSKFIVNRGRVFANPDNYEIVSLITLFRYYNSQTSYLKSSYNDEIFIADPDSIGVRKSATTHLNIFSAKNDFLFSVIPPTNSGYQITQITYLTFFLAFLTLFFLGSYLSAQIWHLHRTNHYEYAFMVLVVTLLLARAIMLYYSIPFIFLESDIFNSKFYGTSPLNPSLGDLALNLSVIAISLFYLVNYYFRMNAYLAIIHSSILKKQLIAVGIVMLSYIIFRISFQQLIDIHNVKSLYRFDISLTADFWKKNLKLCSLLIYIVISVIYFSSTHILINIFIKLFRKEKQSGWLFFIFGSSIILFISFLFKEINNGILIVHTLYFAIVYGMNLPKFIYTFSYKTSIYIFISAFFCASLATYIVYNQSIDRDFELKHDFGRKRLSPNDEIGEYMLSSYRDIIKQDPNIIDDFRNVFFTREIVQEEAFKIFDKNVGYYARHKANKVEINIFDRTGKSLDASFGAKSYHYYNSRYAVKKYQTDHPNLYFINNPKEELSIQYMEFIPIEDQGTIIGYIILQVTPDIAAAYELPVSEEIQPEINNFSYALYENAVLISSGGYGFNYEKNFNPKTFKDARLYTEGCEINGVKHVGVEKGNRKIIVSGEKITPSSIYTNFSFLFLILMIAIVFIVFIYAFRYGIGKTNVNFATRIQIYLNGAFLLPLVLVVIITATIVSRKLSENQKQAYINQTESIAITLKPAIKLVEKGELTEDSLRNIMGNTRRYISIYDLRGVYSFGNRHSTYDGGIFSNYINPAAVTEIIEKRMNAVTLIETIGKLEFTTAYVAIRADDGELIRILCVPFYDAKSVFEQEVLSILGSLLSVFNSIFILLLILSYFASNSLTIPLRLITNKLRKIDLGKKNEALTWRSEDEIGVLIKAYNDMLVKLEESKKALADTNKQSAWQQMAKQVAHEIKNPLTPMKLSLQLLQHKISRGATIDTEQIRGQIESLTSQIDNLSYIANSFSDFARLPIPKQEIFDFIEVLDKIIRLYAENKKIRLIRDISMKSVYVMGDIQLTGNIINNLIVNALQSIPEDRIPPIIMVSVTKGIESITFSVTDNGIGVPKENQNKIFMMDFSTKKEGSGVGLALAKWVVDNANGSLWFETRDQQGSTFFFTLPLAP